MQGSRTGWVVGPDDVGASATSMLRLSDFILLKSGFGERRSSPGLVSPSPTLHYGWSESPGK